MADQQTPSHDGIVSPNPKKVPNLEDMEISGTKLDPVAQSPYTTSSQRQPSSLLDQPHFSQAIQQGEETLQEDYDSMLDNRAPAKRQLRDRKPNNLVSVHGNSGNPNKRARTSPIKPNSSKTFDTKAKIRDEITTATQAQRNSFLVEKQNYFKPLLLENNYIQKLIAQHANLSEDEKIKLPAFVPHQQLETQPQGIKATLKPYQLSGLSYMVYLYRNGVNGILGDDMGLGKTLQTLSLIQYLKENYPTIGRGRLQRPFLIVCPLSVLGSWISETEKWTDLRVVRFHGGREERNRLKHIIAGGIDKLGNLSPQATNKRKRKARWEPSEGEVNSSDRNKDNDEDNDLGVDLVITTYE
ncbi:hypothetical protein EYC80_001812 [Monilinia laxa]|uniref:Helicase ATP-binding domain-containing protein n=1 Tax=Monilinia laxa TaxID=61186 RepID=A0A5N6K677_MONLA|nr:hypothetical protein EYC80_001812 [Monilinia laxa]